MMSRRSVMLSIVLVYAAVVTAWVWHVPYRPGYLLRPIPPTAAFVSVHDELDQRWLDVAQSSLLANVLMKQGVSQEDIAAIAHDPDLKHWVPRLAAKKTVVAYVPEYGPLRHEAWVLVTWVGRYSRLLRWAESIGLADGIRRHTSALGTEIYELVDPVGGGDKAFTFALEDGVLIGCWTAHPGGVSYLHRRSRVQDGSPWREHAALLSAANPDRGLVFPNRIVRNPVLVRPLQVELNRMETDTLEVSVSGHERIMVEEGVAISDDQLQDLSRLLGALPDAVVGLSVGLIKSMLPSRDRRIFDIVTGEALQQISAEKQGLPVVAAALSGDFSGRVGRGNPSFLFQGVKVPTLFLAVPHSSAEQAAASAGLMLDQINGLFQAGLIPRRAEVGDRSMVIVEGTGSDFYSELDIKERVAYAVCDRWVVLCSNSDALRKLLARYDREEAMRFDADLRWRRGVSKDEASLYSWIHVPRVIGSIRAGLTLARFLVPRDEQGARVHDRIAQAVSAVDVLSVLDEIELRLRTRKDGWRANLAVKGNVASTP